MDKKSNAPFIPSGSPMGYVLRNWQKFDAENLKKERLIFVFCNMAWPQYKLGDGEVWPENESDNYNAILPLHQLQLRHAQSFPP